jgi:hypothetical protein
MINTNCSWCKKPFRTRLWTDGRDGSKYHAGCCSDECNSASVAHDAEQRRIKKEAKETPLYLYKKAIKAASQIIKALTGDEFGVTKRGYPVSKRQFFDILKREFMTDDGYYSSKKVLKWKQQRERDWREQYFNQDPVTEEIHDLLLKRMKWKRYTHLFK